MDIPAVIREKASIMNESELEDYIKKVNVLLKTMKTDDRLDIIRITKPETRDLFIEIVKLFMREHEWQQGLSFSKRFTELRKYDLDFIKNSNKKNVTL
jgi:hypothetical protein